MVKDTSATGSMGSQDPGSLLDPSPRQSRASLLLRLIDMQAVAAPSGVQRAPARKRIRKSVVIN